MLKKTLVTTAVLAAAWLSGPVAAQTTDFPNKPVRIVVPFPPGGATDITARVVAEKLSTKWGQPVVIDNKAGAGGNIGTEVIAKARPDGYTVGMGNFAPLAVNHALFKKLNYNPFTDLVPIFLIEKGPLILMVRSDSPYKSVKDLVATAKAAPGKLSYASGGIGGNHLPRRRQGIAGAQRACQRIQHVGKVFTTCGSRAVDPRQRNGRKRTVARRRVVACRSNPLVPPHAVSPSSGGAFPAWPPPTCWPTGTLSSCSRPRVGWVAMPAPLSPESARTSRWSG